MTDAISAIITIGEIVWTLHDYANLVKEAQDEICRLSKELFALKGVLEYIDSRRQVLASTNGADAGTNNTKDIFSSDEFQGVLSSTILHLQCLLTTLQQPKGRLKRAISKLTWPLTKADFEDHIANLERVKSWFILTMMTDSFTLTKDIHTEMRDLTLSLKEEKVQRDEKESAASREKLLCWVAPINPHASQSKASRMRQPGTGGWFVDRDLPLWLNSGIPVGLVLWLKGKSGSGKTTLFSYAVEAVRSGFANAANIGVAFYYCSYSDPESQKTISILGSIVAQLSRKTPAILDALRPIYQKEDSQRGEKHLRITDLEEAIVQATNQLDQVIILVDAINESFDRSQLLASVVNLLTKTCKIRLMITSTFDIPDALNNIRNSCQVKQIGMDVNCINDDIEIYIEAMIRQEPNLCHLNQNIKDEIESTLSQRAGGSFRWASCQINYLSKQLTGSAVRKALHHIPEDLNRTYEQMLLRIPAENRGLVCQVLLWLCFAKRQLTLKELAEAIVFDEAQREINDDDKLNQPTVIIDICHGLVTRDLSTWEVMLAHSSIKTFLLSDWIRQSEVAFFSLDPTSANRSIMRKCLAYLWLDDFKGGYVESNMELEQRFRRYILLPYAAQYWPLHTEEELEPQDMRLIKSFLDTYKLPRGGNFSSWTQYLLGSTRKKDIEHTQPLYYAASYNMLPIVRVLIESRNNTADATEKVDLDAPGGRGGATALNIACFRGHYEVAKALLEAGADPLKGDHFGVPPLRWAREWGEWEIVKLLKEYLKEEADEPYDICSDCSDCSDYSC